LSLGGDVWQVEQGTPSLRANIGIANAVLLLAKAAAPATISDNVKSALSRFLFISSIINSFSPLTVYPGQRAILEMIRP